MNAHGRFKRWFSPILLGVSLCLLMSSSSSAQTCTDLAQFTNPYHCYQTGNCVAYAWYFSYTSWEDSLPKWGDAKYWAGGARNAGYEVKTEAGLYTLAVNTTQYSSAAQRVTGHVGVVWGISGNRVLVREMNYGIGNGVREKEYDVSYFNEGFIYPKNNWRPSVYLTTPPNGYIWRSDYDQNIGVVGTGFNQSMARPVWNYYVPMAVEIWSPTGWRGALRGTQVWNDPYIAYSLGYYWADSFYMRARLNVRGWWRIRVVASNGQRSWDYSFYVQ